MVYNTLCKDERTRRNIYLLLLKNIGVERSQPFFRTMYPNRNHVTTHPDIRMKEFGSEKIIFDKMTAVRT